MQTSLLAFADIRRIVERRIEDFLEAFKPKWIYVDFSGGKDSAAVLAAAVSVSRSVIGTYIHIVGQTHHDNVAAALGVAERLGMRVYRVVARRRGDLRRFFTEKIEMPAMLHVIASDHSLGVDYWSAVLRYGFPAPLERSGSGKRWCCAHFKSDWLSERPPNGFYSARPARFIMVGVRRSESAYRRRLWAGKLWQTFKAKDGVIDVVLAPIVDFSENDVWVLLKRYRLYEIVRSQYERWKRAPNCVLCPLMGKHAFQSAISNLPTPYLQKVMRILEEIRPRYKEGTYSAKKINEWLGMIGEELGERCLSCDKKAE